ncbi:MAG: serine/threonine-protein kinase [Bacteroidales bacterium]|nr:serine/threonine-protein kinase [Candidatus Latescibacterota bacterium]
MIGKTVGHFNIIEELGEGGMGAVYKASDTNLDRFVALKLLPPHLCEDEDTRKRFIREAKAASALEHPNICTIYEIGELPDGRMFMAMGYYEGDTLEDRLKGGALEIEDALDIATQVASGLAAAHLKGLVHRDIKPSNIMISPDGHIKILDFGVAKLAGQTVLTMAGTSLGTIAYMSPEQVSAQEVDARSDIFSFSVMFYEMLTGNHPFIAEHEAAIIYRIMNEDPNPLSDYISNLPPEYQSFFDTALKKNVEDRLPSLDEFIEKLKGPSKVRARMPEPGKITPPKKTRLTEKGDMIESFRLLERVGVGGMGEVWAAEQEAPFHRKVALKILKAGMDTEEVVARFEAERQALALMDHPCIAQVYDAGSTPAGRPFFAMEYVKGVSITEYCDKRKLGTEKRLRLFMRLCEGVQHAHHKAVIHRDLKPNNVLVTEIDDKPVPKIIDFGVAKATSAPLTDKKMHTHIGQLIGTPEYMSPEQAELTGEDIDTRTDIYSLGVILYELLAGALPFNSTMLREAGFEGIKKTIRDVEPAKPSTKVTTLGDGSSANAQLRRTDPASLSSQLKGDLDWIIMKALDKDRNRRYASAMDMSADIERHLNDEPVLASPPSRIYKIKKFAKRHRAGVAAASVVVLAVFLGIAGTTIGMIRAIRAEKLALREAETVKSVSTFMEGLFEVSDPGEARGNSITAREILDKGAGRISRELADQPLVQARLMVTMGRVYRNLGLYDSARSLLEQALDLRREKLGDKDLNVSDSCEELAALLGAIGDFETALPLFEEARTIREEILGSGHPEVGLALSNLGNLYRSMGDNNRAIPLYEKAIEIREKALGHDHIDVSNSLNGLAIVYEAMGDYEMALPLYEQSLAIREKVLGDDHPRVATSLNNLATLLWMKKDFAKARIYNSRAKNIQEKVLGPDHPDLAHTLNTCANLQLAAGNLEMTRKIHLRALGIREKNLRPDHPRIIESYYNLACVSAKMGEHEVAISYLRESVDRGFAYNVIFEDPDLESLHGNPEFEVILDGIRRRLGISR